MCGAAGAAFAAAPEGAASGVPDSIRRFEMLTLSGPAGASAPGSGAMQARAGGRRLAVTFHTLGRTFDLDLEPNNLFAPGARNVWIDEAGTVEEAPSRIFYRGRVRGSDDSWVRVAVRNGTIDGMIWTPEETYFVEPAGRFFADAAADEMITYRQSDTVPEWTDESCAVAVPHRRHLARLSSGAKPARSLNQALTAALQQSASAVQMKVLDLGLVADYEYYLRHGGDSMNFLHTLMNLMDGVYQREINLKVRVSHTVVYSTASDPFGSTTVPLTLLDQFSTYKSNNSGAGGLLFGADLAHLFTGRDLDSNVIGIAWLGTTCSFGNGAGVSQDYRDANQPNALNSLVSLTAHEVGHNLNASHDTDVDCPQGFIMYPSVLTVGNLNDLHFSSCSKGAISSHVASRSCLAAAVPNTPTPTPTSIPTPSATRTATLTPTPPPEQEPRARELITAYYTGILGRAPEAGAVDAWFTGYFLAAVNAAFDVRFAPQEMGRLFFLSQEYTSRNRTDAQFIADCYQVFLRRPPAQAELDAWLADLSWNRPQVVALFARSEEFTTYVQGLFPGLSGVPARNLVTTMYVGLLDRLVDAAGLGYFAGRFESAYTTAGIEGVRGEARALGRMTLASAEYQSKSPTNQTHVERLYRGYLGRFPATSELDYWRGELDAGRWTTNTLIDAFAASAEFTALLNATFGPA